MSNNNIQNGIPPSSSIEISNESLVNYSFTEAEVNITETQPADEVTTESVAEVTAQPPEAPVVQNGVSTPIVTPSPAPVNKSWASLFSAKSNGITSDVVNNSQTKAFSETTSNKVMDDVPLCPIKNPKKNVFIDPDCYRMGGNHFGCILPIIS